MPSTPTQISHSRSHRRNEGAVIYYTVFSITFVFALIAFSASRLAGRRFERGLLDAARRAAQAPAAYAVMY